MEGLPPLISTKELENRACAQTERNFRKLAGKLASERTEIQLKIERLMLRRRAVSEELTQILADHPRALQSLRLVRVPKRDYPLAATIAILDPRFAPHTISMLGSADNAAVSKMLETLPEKEATALRTALDTAGTVTYETQIRPVKRGRRWS